MNGRQLGAGIMVMSTILLCRPAQAAQIDRPNLVIRAYLTMPLHGNDWRAAVGEATAILDETGIQVGWINCSAPHLSGTSELPERCTQPLKTNEVAIRIIRVNNADHRSGQPLGESLVDAPRRVGTLATIYLDRVEWLASGTGVRTSTVLARALAHEVAHLIFGTTAHSREGLMRPVWTRLELIRARAVDWHFPAGDALRLRQAFARRLAPAPESVVVWSTD